MKLEGELKDKALEWIEKSGSARLKRCVEEGFGWSGLFKCEYRASIGMKSEEWRTIPVERAEGGPDDTPYNLPRTPSDEVFAFLDECRAEARDTRLRFHRGKKQFVCVVWVQGVGWSERRMPKPETEESHD